MNEGVAGVEVASMVGELREALVGLDLPYFFWFAIGFGIWVRYTVEEWIQSIHDYFA
jgi:hypothetical protein